MNGCKGEKRAIGAKGDDHLSKALRELAALKSFLRKCERVWSFFYLGVSKFMKLSGNSVGSDALILVRQLVQN